MVTGSEDGFHFKIWDWKTGENVHTITEHQGIVYTFLKVSEELFISGSADKTAISWSLPNIEVVN